MKDLALSLVTGLTVLSLVFSGCHKAQVPASAGQSAEAMQGKSADAAPSERYVSNPGQYIHSVITIRCRGLANQVQLGYQSVEWNQEGMAVAIHGIEPHISEILKPEMKVLSDLQNPKLVNGVLTLTIEGKGDLEFVLMNNGGGIMTDDQACKLF